MVTQATTQTTKERRLTETVRTEHERDRAEQGSEHGLFGVRRLTGDYEERLAAQHDLAGRYSSFRGAIAEQRVAPDATATSAREGAAHHRDGLPLQAMASTPPADGSSPSCQTFVQKEMIS